MARALGGVLDSGTLDVTSAVGPVSYAPLISAGHRVVHPWKPSQVLDQHACSLTVP
jgi:hypothetical protein